MDRQHTDLQSEDCEHTDCFMFSICRIKDMAQHCAMNKDYFDLEDMGKKKEVI